MKVFLASLLFTLVVFSFGKTSGQALQWIKGGGTNESSSYLDNDPEGSYYMCTDKYGNVYSLNIVGQNAIFADTFYRGSAYGVDINMLLASYNCSGQMRWAKLIGSNAGECRPYGILADSTGHVYIAATMYSGTLHIGYDTTITSSIYSNLGLIQFDTSGNFNWIRFVGNNTMASYVATGTTVGSLSLDNQNNVHFFPWIKTGALLLPSVTSHYGMYDLKYNSGGTLLSARRLQIDSTILVTKTNIDKRSNVLYACGYRNGLFSDSSAYNFLAAFDTNGNQLWIDTIGTNPALVTTGNFSGIETDGHGHLYICGAGYDYLTYQGDTIRAPIGAYIAFIMKTDTAGNKQWVKTPQGHTAFVGITKASDNVIAATGYYYVSMSCGPVVLTNPTPGLDPIVFSVDTLGQFIDLQGYHGNGYSDYGNCITHDRYGNIFVGGMAADTLPTSLSSPYVSVGGNTDFFVLKYGMPCGCTALPVASFSTSGTNPVTFTYTGSTTGIDSVVWHFGDGTTSTGVTVNHTYTYSDTFHICQFTYAYCGIDSSCVEMQVAGLGVNSLETTKLSLAPNPATEQIAVIGLTSNTNYRLLDITGRCIGQGVVSPGIPTISMQQLTAGVYLLELSSPDSQPAIFRVVKQ